MFTFTIYFFMTISLIGIIFCAKKQSEDPKFKTIAIALFAVLFICTLVLLSRSSKTETEETTKTIENQLNNQRKTETYNLGEYLAKGKKSYKNALIILMENPNNKKNIESIKKGLGNSIENIEVEIIKEQKMIIEPLFSVKVINNILKKHQTCNLVISLIGLPSDFSNMTISDTTPRFAVCGFTPSTKIASLIPFIQNEFIIVLIAPRNSFEDIPSYKNIFITKKNLNSMKKTYSKTFFRN